MPLIHLRVRPSRVRYTLSSLNYARSPLWAAPAKAVSVRGRPVITGTYHWTRLELRSSGKRIELPNRAEIHLVSGESNPGPPVEVTYLEAWNDEELTISYPAHFSVTVRLPAEALSTAVACLASNGEATLSVRVDFEVPEANASGYDGLWDIAECGSSGTGPLPGVGYLLEVTTRNGSHGIASRRRDPSADASARLLELNTRVIHPAVTEIRMALQPFVLLAAAILAVTLATCFRA